MNSLRSKCSVDPAFVRCLEMHLGGLRNRHLHRERACKHGARFRRPAGLLPMHRGALAPKQPWVNFLVDTAAGGNLLGTMRVILSATG